ncbi:MAG TPA: diacylglycerol kinase family protein [Tepidisphaeraceae bacterium]|nr:diacylglycerol kinase family protein [Tepidisphaeraceae bacterium]
MSMIDHVLLTSRNRPSSMNQAAEVDAQNPDILLFSNPIAGRGLGGVMTRRIAQRLRDEGFTVHEFVEPAEQIADRQLACPSLPRAAICVGGDGTVRAVAERLLRYFGDCTQVPPLLMVPLGTANLLARHLGIQWDPQQLDEQVVQALRAGRRRELDTARANGRLFLLMAGIGIDAAIVHELHRLRRGSIDVMSYVAPTMRALRTYDYPPLRVEVDGQCVFGPAPAVAFVGNVSQYGTGFPILVHARSDDRWLDVCVLPCRSALDVMHLALLAAAGEHLHEDGVVYTKGRSVRIESSGLAPVQIDGEPAGHTPVHLQLLDGRLAFIVQSSLAPTGGPWPPGSVNHP